MLIPVLLFIVGLLCLIKGGDWFVDGATGIARRFHVPELLIGEAQQAHDEQQNRNEHSFLLLFLAEQQ